LTVAALLGHAARGVTQRYIHIDEALRLAADKGAAEISDLLEGLATAPRACGRRVVVSAVQADRVADRTDARMRMIIIIVVDVPEYRASPRR